MERNHQLALIIAYYLSRFDRLGLESIGYSTFEEAFKATSVALNIKSNTVKNMRDEFDPNFDNPRAGWHQRKPRPSRQAVITKFDNYSKIEMANIVKRIIADPLSDELTELIDSLELETDHILKDLGKIAIYTKEQIRANFNAEEVSLSEEFKHVFGSYIRSIGQNIFFQENTAIITSAGNLKIYAPNQWFVIASFLTEFVRELINYRKHLDNILNDKFTTAAQRKEFIKSMRGTDNENSKEDFISLAKGYFKNLTDDVSEIEKCANYMALFITDYNWWHGSKTIDRGDYYVSAALNLAGVVNVSQGYIADIAYFYATESRLERVVKPMIMGGASHEIISTSSDPDLPRKIGGQNLIIYGAPGTGKSRRLEDMFGTAPLTRRVVFHPEYTYYDFVGSYKPSPIYKNSDDSLVEVNGEPFTKGEPFIDYQFVPGPFTQVLVEAWLDPSNIHTLIIEEINRANAASVFGEVFQLLDRNPDGTSEYSFQPSKDLEAYLLSIDGMDKFIRKGISLPSNMNIVATMNSADQGVNIIDSAFKRRWNYIYMRIEIDKAVHKDDFISYNGQNIKWGIFINALNDKLKSLRIDEDKLIGPYFIKPNELNNSSAMDKLLLYLWDDVLRHRREQFFNNEIRSFSDLSDRFKYDDVLGISEFISSYSGRSIDELLENNEEKQDDNLDDMENVGSSE